MNRNPARLHCIMIGDPCANLLCQLAHSLRRQHGVRCFQCVTMRHQHPDIGLLEISIAAVAGRQQNGQIVLGVQMILSGSHLVQQARALRVWCGADATLKLDRQLEHGTDMTLLRGAFEIFMCQRCHRCLSVSVTLGRIIAGPVIGPDLCIGLGGYSLRGLLQHFIRQHRASLCEDDPDQILRTRIASLSQRMQHGIGVTNFTGFEQADPLRDDRC